MTHSLFALPRFRGGSEEEDRRPTWLELFYDLVYVATIVQLGNRLSDDVSIGGFISFVLIFAPVWWLWVGMTRYSNRFDSDDLIHRLLVFAQIFTVVILAISVYNATTTTGEAFALAYATGRVILVLMYIRAYCHVPEARPLTIRYIIGISIAAAIWFVSAFVPPPLRYLLWAAGLAVDTYVAISPASFRIQVALPPSPRHLPERFGLFTMIVIGESFLKVIGGLSGQTSDFPSIVADIPGFLSRILADIPALVIVISLWWVYFDDIAESAIRVAGRWPHVWLYGHFPLHVGIVALSVGIYKLVQRVPGDLLPEHYRWLICGAGAICLIAVAVMELATREKDKVKQRYDIGLRLAGAVVLLLIAVGGGGVGVTLLMTLIALPFVTQVAFDIYWRRRTISKIIVLEGIGE
jgi:low temperature requirement protein LtrA